MVIRFIRFERLKIIAQNSKIKAFKLRLFLQYIYINKHSKTLKPSLNTRQYTFAHGGDKLF